MKKTTSGLVLATLLTASVTAWAEPVGQTVGEAFDLESNELLYRETHCVIGSEDAREVIYQNDAGDLIAHKRVDYRSGEFTPSFVQQNFYSRERIEVAMDDGRVLMSVRDEAQPEAVEVSSDAPEPGTQVVIDAGFDYFVRNHWDELVSGEIKEFAFPFAARSSLVDLRIRRFGCSYESETDQCFRLELSNWLYRMLAAPIELGYDATDRRLTRYRGLSNIGDGKGNGQVVDIRYDYDNVPAQACAIPRQALTDNADLPDPVPYSVDRES
ncbi:MAG: hypothetical protein QNJ85_12655 [Gammaproteobacteria bacterium]|nr:hypothetical protein [Gammaproteobacteria bacterium]